MQLYQKNNIQPLHEHQFAFLEIEFSNHVLTITLNRPQKKNALHPQMMNELAYAIHFAHFEKDVWIIVIAAKGNVFCAGADLKAMAGIIEPHDSTIPIPEGDVLIGELFNKVHKPTIAKVTGDVYAGGFFFLAGATIVVAQEGVTFGLPEVKRGLFPFQVMASLLKIMPSRKVLDWCIRGYNLDVQEAAKYGLVTEVVATDAIDQTVASIVDELFQNSPSAIQKGLEAFDHINPSASDHKYLFDMLQKTIASNDGMEGLKAFREKRKPEWSGE